MKSLKTAILSTGFVGALLVGAASSAATAGQSRIVGTLQPSKGMSFDVGSKRAVSYFLSTDGGCKLTLLLAEGPDEDGVSPSSASRVQLLIGPGAAARVDTAEGKALEFYCKTGARAMSVEALEQVAWAPAK